MESKRVAIIGAGVSGIGSVKECLAAGLKVKCFEKSPWIAGIWHSYDDDTEGNNAETPMYKNCVCNLSTSMFSFTDFPVPKSWPTFLPVKLIDEYLNMYVDNFSLREHIYTSHTVTKVSQDPKTKTWHVRYRILDASEESEELFDWVFVCTGRYSKPYIPYINGQETFEGELLHLAKYWEPTKYTKKRVVVVGTGSSGCDSSLELSYHAAKTYLVQHTGRHYLTRMDPKTLKPSDQAITRLLFGMIPKPARDYIVENLVLLRPPWLLPSDVPFGDKPPTITSTMFFERLATGSIEAVPSIASISGRDIHLTDGRVLSNIDTIICATGYEIGLESFLEDTSVYCHWPEGVESIQRRDGSVVTKKSPLLEKAWLWKSVLPPGIEGIAFVGYIEAAYGAPTVYETQARYLAALINSQTLHPLPSVSQMHTDIQAHYRTLTRYQELGHIDDIAGYIDWLAEEAAGAKPSFWRITREYGFELAKRVFTKPMISQQWRLTGKGKWDGAEIAIREI